MSTQAARPGTGAERTAPRDQQDEVKPRRWWPVVTPIAVVVIAVSLLLPAGRHQWALSLFRQPTPYTILAFNNPSTLPVTTRKNDPVEFGFRVGNQEGRSVRYRYVLSVMKNGHSRILGKSSKTVAAGATWTVAATIRPACGSTECRIEVSLPGHPETIYFILNSPAQGKVTAK